MENKAHVFVADNSRIHVLLLADALKSDPNIKVVGSACHAHEIMKFTAAHKVDIVLISSHLDGTDRGGLEVLRQLQILHPEVRTVVLTDSSQPLEVVEVFRAGARGIFSRHESLESLIKCVRQVHAGQVWANSQQMSFVINALAASPTVRATNANGLNLLSKRELHVVGFVAEGLSNREIAARLHLSPHTIKNYLFRVFEKLGVSSRMELLLMTLTYPTHEHMPGSYALANRNDSSRSRLPNVGNASDRVAA